MGYGHGVRKRRIYGKMEFSVRVIFRNTGFIIMMTLRSTCDLYNQKCRSLGMALTLVVATPEPGRHP